MRTATIMSKVFLHHLTPLISLTTFNELWMDILDYIEKFLNIGSDMLHEAMLESLKNMLLVMHSVRVFHNEDGQARSPLWHLTWKRVDAFLPHLRDEIFDKEQRKFYLLCVQRRHLILNKIFKIPTEPTNNASEAPIVTNIPSPPQSNKLSSQLPTAMEHVVAVPIVGAGNETHPLPQIVQDIRTEPNLIHSTQPQYMPNLLQDSPIVSTEEPNVMMTHPQQQQQATVPQIVSYSPPPISLLAHTLIDKIIMHLSFQPIPEQSYEISIDYMDRQAMPVPNQQHPYPSQLPPLYPIPSQSNLTDSHHLHSQQPLASTVSDPSSIPSNFTGNLIELSTNSVYQQPESGLALPSPMPYTHQVQSNEGEIFNDYVNNPYNGAEAAAAPQPPILSAVASVPAAVTLPYLATAQYPSSLSNSFASTDPQHRPPIGLANVFQSANYFGATDGQDVKMPPGSEMLFTAP